MRNIKILNTTVAWLIVIAVSFGAGLAVGAFVLDFGGESATSVTSPGIVTGTLSSIGPTEIVVNKSSGGTATIQLTDETEYTRVSFNVAGEQSEAVVEASELAVGDSVGVVTVGDDSGLAAQRVTIFPTEIPANLTQ
ncbi:MAG: hypothetical protein A2932_02085 [Candidatus Spechtbacteria bacterium RIFCSPLOWO2_01_FULL_46_10]|uniref:DUF5666 domain-containing protein n=1 Tax=Candidatus Spechtbacteria bacterium RIFCSPLOWO2_01_FULL_46_10 TaxID=1802163 RepID=A0A1G2HFM3_9BACT|nr:MAG: hypothetical protein A2932_02085 [Candidatus Spechtbacteria bacterium RIFCSPLOWO2_01_FULL_46_10]